VVLSFYVKTKNPVECERKHGVILDTIDNSNEGLKAFYISIINNVIG
jgi:hypothetical protein